ncbi:MAG: hypothetical protein LBD58_04595, partial [Treponema sp.]|nr:hypothetical protein [Treponema sp.]
MKKERIAFAIGVGLMSLMLLACPTVDLLDSSEIPEEPTVPEEPEEPTVPVSKYDKEYWGEWVRMDTGKKWYISSSAITIDTGYGNSSVSSVSLSKQSDRVIEVSEGGRKYYLYASRTANTRFTG